MKTIALAVALYAALMWPAAYAQHEHAATPATTPYSPGLGEIMTLQQMRHSKLWFAGRGRNWALADYEVDELKEGFEDVEKLFPSVDSVPITAAVKAIMENELAGLGKAVEAKDAARFAAAFDKLTVACNACHQTAKHAFIVIQRPASLPYTNQSFAPARLRAGGAHH